MGSYEWFHTSAEHSVEGKDVQMYDNKTYHGYSAK